MSKGLKITLKIVAFFVLLYLIAIALLATFLKPDHYKGYIDHWVNEHTGRHLVIKGDISLSFFPWMGVKVNDLSLGNPKNFPTSAKPYFIHMDEADVKIAFWPLFMGKVDPKLITLQGADINMITTPSGRVNWVMQPPAQNTKPATQSAAPVAKQGHHEDTHSSNSFTFVSLPKVAIIDSHVSWNNQQNNHLLQIKNVNLRTSSIDRKNAAHISTSFDVLRNNPNLDITLNANTNLLFDLPHEKFNLLDLVLEGHAKKLFGQTSSRAIPFGLKGDLRLDLQKQTLDLEKMSASLANIHAQINAKAQDILSIGKAQGELTIATFNPSQTLRELQAPVHVQDSSAWQRLSFHTRFQASPKYIKLTNIKGVLDKSRLQGNVNFAVLPKKNMDFDFNLNQLNLNHYRLVATQSAPPVAAPRAPATSAPSVPAKRRAAPQPPSPPSPAPNAKQATSSNQTLIPVNTLKNINWDGKVQVGQLQYQAATFNHVDLLTKSAHHIITISPFKANIGQGSIQSNTQLNLSGSTPSMNTSLHIQNAPAAPLLSLVTQQKVVDGTINLQAQFSSQGITKDQILKALNGQGQFALQNGTLYGYNISDAVNKALTVVHKKRNTSHGDEQNMSVADMSAQFKINNGMLNSYNLQMLSNNITITGTGQLNLLNDAMDYHIQTHITGVDFPIPILITGSLSKPKIQPDIKAIGQQVIQHTVKQKVGKLINSIFGK